MTMVAPAEPGQLGVPVHESKLFYRIQGDQLRQQAARS